jgi:preprotein translocase subunit YajC
MKKSFVLLMLLPVLISLQGSSFAQDSQGVSAPSVVAPAQPAAPVQTSASSQAPASASAAPAPQQPGMLGMAVPFLIMLGVMYFLMIRPQQKRMKEHQSLMSSLQNGDEVVTSAGIIGTIAGMSDKVVTLEVSKNVQLKILKSQVNQVVKGPIKDIQPTA